MEKNNTGRVREQEIHLSAPCQGSNTHLIEMCLEKPIKWTRLPYYVAWFLIAEVLFFVHYVLLIVTATSDPFWLFTLLLSIAFGWMTVEMIWTCRQFESFFLVVKNLLDIEEGEIQDWYGQRLRAIFSPRGMIITGIVFLAVFGTMVFGIANYGYWLESKLVLYYDYVFYGMTFVVGGMSQYCFYGLSIFIHRLPVKDDIQMYASVNITHVGRLLFKVGFGGIGLIVLGGLMLYLSPFQKHAYLYVTLLVFLLGSGCWFFITQYRIHHILLRQRDAKTDAIAVHMKKAVDNAVLNPSSHAVQRVNELKGLLMEIKSMPVWSFDPKTVLSFLSMVVIPGIVIILQLFFR